MTWGQTSSSNEKASLLRIMSNDVADPDQTIKDNFVKLKVS